jgi:hypothetical protein
MKMPRQFCVEAYYKGKLVMCLPDVQAEKYGDALEIGKEKMKEINPKMKNHGFNVKLIK